MIVDPDFFEHWRTRMLVDALGGDQMAPMYVMRIWAHCQSRRATSFDMPAAGLRSLCRFSGDAALLESSLIDAGFIERNGAAIDAPTWAEYNSKLIANWRNGATGGRPKASDEEPTDNPRITQQEPMETQPEPTGTHAYPIREDKSREDIKPKPSSSSGDDGAVPKPFDRFWSVYPRKVGKMSAQKAWAKIKPDTELVDTILAAIAVQLEGADWKRDDGEFVPHGSTWLNGGRWMDEVRPYAEPKPRHGRWWETKESMAAFGLTLTPPLTPNRGELPADFGRRINEAIERGDRPAPVAQPTPYVPPAPAGGESILTAEQQAARRTEMLALVGSRKHAAAGAA